MNDRIDRPEDRNQGTNLGANDSGHFLDGSSSSSDDAPVKTGLQVFADIGVSIGTQVDELKKSVRSLADRLEYDTPVDYQSVGSGTFVTGSPLIVSLGSPDQGTFWELKTLVIGGLDVNLTAAGTAGVYVSALPVQVGLLGAVGLATALPYATTWGTRQVVVNEQQSLFVIIFGGTNGQQYLANAQVTVYQSRAAHGKTTTTS